MKTKIEGILIKKIPYKDRHIIAHLLLRSGRKVSIMFYGGQPGGKKLKASTLEVGHMLKVELQITKRNHSIYRAKEWSVHWFSTLIRDHFRAFCLMCFILEITSRIATEDDLHDEHGEFDKESLGIFNVLSNALFSIDKELENKTLNENRSLLIFLAKLSLKQGIYPSRYTCTLSGESIKEGDSVELVFQEGGFALADYCQSEGRGLSLARMELWNQLNEISSTNYKELSSLELKYSENVRLFFNYFCYHFHYQESDFYSFKSFFSS